MKYIFMAVLHNMEIETKISGTKITPYGKLSNSPYRVNKIMNTDIAKSTLGIHSIDEFKNSTFYLVENEFKELKSLSELDSISSALTFFHLREMESYLHELWRIKDNNVYIRDGFTFGYSKTIEDGFTQKTSLTSIYSKADSDRNNIIFTAEEIKKISSDYDAQELKVGELDLSKLKHPSDDLFQKKNGMDRIDMSTFFIMNARANPFSSMKILYYCSALECLFSTSTSELNHKVAERTSNFLSKDNTERYNTFNLVKKAYDIRSRIIHGTLLNKTSDELVKISKEMDNICRRLHNLDLELLKLKNDDLEVKLNKLLFDIIQQIPSSNTTISYIPSDVTILARQALRHFFR